MKQKNGACMIGKLMSISWDNRNFPISLWEVHNQYRKFSEISAALGISATIIHLQNNYWGISPTPDPSKDTFHQISATK